MNLPPIRAFFQKVLPKRGDAPFSFAFTAPVLASFCLILVCAVAWAFFMGYMVGKGQHPGAHLPDMAGFFKSEEKIVLPAPEQQENDSAQEAAAEPALLQTVENNAQTAAAGPQTASLPFVRPKGEETAAWGDTAPVPAAKPAPAQKTPPPARERFAYTFQIAAFRTNDEATRLCAALKKEAINARPQKNGKVFLVMTNFTGTAADVAAFRQKLQKLKLGAPLQLGKKSALPQASEKRR